MKIAIIGAGNIGRTLGKKWAAAEHEVVFGSRTPDSSKMQAILAETGGRVAAAGISQAITFGEVVLLATPWAAVHEVVAAHGSALDGKIVIDATNNFGAPVINNLATIHAGAPWAKVFRAFNSLGWEIFANPHAGGLQADMFYCGNEGEERALVERLIEDIGLRPIWVGELDRLPLVDNLGALWVTLALRQGLGRRLALKAMTD